MSGTKHKTVRSNPQLRAAIAAAIVGMSSSTPAASEVRGPVDIDIEPQALQQALEIVSETFDLSVFASGELVKDRQAPAVVGNMTSEEAVSRLLEGSGLTSSRSRSGAIMIRAANQDQNPRSSISATRPDPRGLERPTGPPSDEITVVGTRFQNSLVTRLPIPEYELASTLDTIDEEKLEELNFLRLEETFLTLPNVSVGGTNYAGGNFFVGLRGFQFSSTLINNRPVQAFRGSGLDRSAVETVEVLKGPTSIVFGPVTPGGIINQVLKTPKDDDFANVDVMANTFGTVRGEIDLNSSELFGNENIRGRITLAYEDGSHPADEVGRDALTIRPIVEADIGDSTSLQAAFYYRDLQGGFEPYFPLNTDLTIPAEIDPDTFIGSATNRLDNEYSFLEAQLVHNFLDDLKLTVRGSYLDTEGDQAYGNGFYRYSYYDSYDPAYQLNGLPPNDRTGYRYGFVRANNEEQEYLDVQLAASFDWFGQDNDALIGVTYSNRDTFNTDFVSEDLGVVDLADRSTFIGPPVTIDLPTGVGGFFNEDTLKSVYGEVYLRPTERITIPFGIRYDELEESRANSAIATPDVRTESDTTIKTGVSVEVTESLRAFYSYAESFVPQPGLARTGFLNPERGSSHEVGIKYRGANGLVIDAAIFEITRADIAVGDPTNGPGENFQVTAGEQQSTGFELSVSGDIGDDFSFSFDYGYADAEITEETFGEIGRIATVPRFNGSAYLSYQPQGGNSRLRASAGVRFTDEVTLRAPAVADPGRDLGFVDGYTIADIMVGYEFSDSLDAQLNVYNVFDEEYLQAFGFGFGAGGGFTFGQPVNAQLRLRWSF